MAHLSNWPEVPSVPLLFEMNNPMELCVNGIKRELPEGTTVAQLIEELDLDPRSLAVERNLELVPRARHQNTRLEAGDRVEIVTLVGGG